MEKIILVIMKKKGAMETLFGFPGPDTQLVKKIEEKLHIDWSENAQTVLALDSALPSWVAVMAAHEGHPARAVIMVTAREGDVVEGIALETHVPDIKIGDVVKGRVVKTIEIEL